MNDLADTWVLWLVLTMLSVGGVLFYRRDHRSTGQLYTSSEDFNIRHILFGFSKGEGDLFLGYVLAIIFFALFLIGFVRWVQIIG